MTDALGHNKQFSLDDVNRSVLERLQSWAKTKNKQVPEDVVDFLKKANVIYLDAQGQPVHFERVVIQWED